ncbi:hypothetical protein CBM2631_B170020 [Cupriavidus taiwanensis]|nr:hypothetical protein CBM2588_B180020 [Cupriavidus taiwanensis]SOY94694.1 hypothetical protein CBM2591_B130020 [Cupriavidus taiwanensis]SOZ86483.1 hypothetical protein CBM2618_B190006 [Cupriavidus taiwanensis]SOZ89761.1 hypothetical protein CBM2622_B180020 [Cupriavidus taiwanensis]SOZ94496.1 hypothetical protein CBM2621_B180020 [Cupriavidus taiwanensis]
MADGTRRRGLLLAQARRGLFAGAAGGAPGARFGAVRVVAHGDVGDDAFGAIAVFRNHVGREPEAGFLLDRIDGNGIRVVSDGIDSIQWLTCSWRGRSWRVASASDATRGAVAAVSRCDGPAPYLRGAGVAAGVKWTVPARADAPVVRAIVAERNSRRSDGWWALRPMDASGVRPPCRRG